MKCTSIQFASLKVRASVLSQLFDAIQVQLTILFWIICASCVWLFFLCVLLSHSPAVVRFQWKLGSVITKKTIAYRLQTTAHRKSIGARCMCVRVCQYVKWWNQRWFSQFECLFNGFFFHFPSERCTPDSHRMAMSQFHFSAVSFRHCTCWGQEKSNVHRISVYIHSDGERTFSIGIFIYQTFDWIRWIAIFCLHQVYICGWLNLEMARSAVSMAWNQSSRCHSAFKMAVF